MVKRFCDICGNEISTNTLYNIYEMHINSAVTQNKMTRNYEDVCLDCVKSITKYIEVLQTKQEGN